MHPKEPIIGMTRRLAAGVGSAAGPACAMALCLAMVTPAQADSQPPRFDKYEISMEDGNYVITMTIQYEISDIVIEALQHGVSLEIDTNLQAIELTPWWPDRVLHQEAVRRRLHYHVISEQYVVTDLTHGQQNSYYGLPRALQTLGEVSWQIPASNIDSPSRQVELQIRNYLDIDRLPLLLQLVARTHPDWRKLSLPTQKSLKLP